MKITVEMLESALIKAGESSNAKAWELEKLHPEMLEVLRVAGSSDKMKNAMTAAMAMGALTALLMSSGKQETEAERQARIDKMTADNPIRAIALELFFAGYLLGKNVSEVEKLEAITA